MAPELVSHNYEANAEESLVSNSGADGQMGIIQSEGGNSRKKKG